MSSSSARLLLAGALIVATAGTAAAWRGPRCIGAGRDAVPAPFVLEAARARRIRPSAPPGARRRMSGRSSWAPPNPGHRSIELSGRANSLRRPVLPLTTVVTAQLVAGDRCWRANYGPFTRLNDAEAFRARAGLTPPCRGPCTDW